MKGQELSHCFFRDVVEPAVSRAAPGLPFSAGLLGDGSEVLGYDDAISTDHDFGPRLQLFLGENDFSSMAQKLMGAISAALPESYDGWPTHFPDPDRPFIIDPSAGVGGCREHGVEIYTIRGWTERHIGLDLSRRLPTPAEWAWLDQQRLLSMVEGEVFRDDNGRLAHLRQALAQPPLAVRLTKMADIWDSISQEAAFVGRAGDVGDDLGSRLITARIAEQLMRLCFMIEGRYAPYSKWFGTAWTRLPCAAFIAPLLRDALAADEWRHRESAIGAACLAVAKLHHSRALPGDFDPSLMPYFSRPYTVINADRIGRAVRQAAQGTQSVPSPPSGFGEYEGTSGRKGS